MILRSCPVCERDSISGHGRRRKQAHDEHHDWIGIRRGRCHGCGKTFTFLPPLSLPYTHYSLLARCQALRRRFEAGGWRIYNGVGVVKHILAAPLQPRAGRGVKGGPAFLFLAGPFIADP